MEFLQSFNVGRADNTIIGLSPKFPFPGKLALREEVASRSAGITEQVLRVKERDLIARVKRAYYDPRADRHALEYDSLPDSRSAGQG